MSLGKFRQLLHPASVFFTQKDVFLEGAGQFYTRHDVLRLHANKLGGVHLDFKRAPDEAHIDEIKNYFGFDSVAHPLQMMRGADIATARSDPNRRPNIYDATELVALDTARIFAKGIKSSASLFKALLQ